MFYNLRKKIITRRAFPKGWSINVVNVLQASGKHKKKKGGETACNGTSYADDKQHIRFSDKYFL